MSPRISAIIALAVIGRSSQGQLLDPKDLAKATPGAVVALPFSRGKQIFTTRAAGNGVVNFCVQDGLNGKPRTLLSSKTDPMIAIYPLPDFAVSDDGKLLAHFATQTDDKRFESIPLIDIKSDEQLPDQVRWTHYSDFGFHGKGFYYGLYPKPVGDTTPGSNASPYHDEVIMYHHLGQPQSKDQVVLKDPANPNRKHLFLNTFDQKWLLVHTLDTANGKRVRSEMFRREGKMDGPFTTYISGKEGATYLIDDVDGQILMMTSYGDPKGRLIEVDPAHPEEQHWKQVVADGEPGVADGNPVLGMMAISVPDGAGGTKASIFDLHGKHLYDIPTEPGTKIDLQFGRRNEHWAFLSTQKGTEPKKFFSFDPKSRKLTQLK